MRDSWPCAVSGKAAKAQIAPRQRERCMCVSWWLRSWDCLWCNRQEDAHPGTWPSSCSSPKHKSDPHTLCVSPRVCDCTGPQPRCKAGTRLVVATALVAMPQISPMCTASVPCDGRGQRPPTRAPRQAPRCDRGDVLGDSVQSLRSAWHSRPGCQAKQRLGRSPCAPWSASAHASAGVVPVACVHVAAREGDSPVAALSRHLLVICQSSAESHNRAHCTSTANWLRLHSRVHGRAASRNAQVVC